MRILILSQHYPPEPAMRLKDLTEYLKKQGHDVSVLTTFPSYPVGRVYEGYKMSLRKKSHEYDARVTRVYSFPYRGLRRSKRLFSYFSFAAASLLLGLIPSKKPDVIYVYHPPLTTGWAAATYHMLRKVPFVYDVQDVWPEAIVAAGMMRENSRPYKALRMMEGLVYKRAAKITVISEGMRRNLLSKGVPETKLSIISNSGNSDVYKPLPFSETRTEKGWDGKFVVMLAGNLSLTHGLDTVIEAAELLKEHPNIHLVFLGSGPVRGRLQEQVKRKELTNVEFLDRVKEEGDAAKLINAADAMLVHLREASVGDFSVPHRLFSYMLCGKPIIAASSGSAAELVESQECGWTCPASDPEALSKLIVKVSSDPEACKQVGERGLSVAQGPFSKDRLLRQIEETIEQAIGKR